MVNSLSIWRAIFYSEKLPEIGCVNGIAIAVIRYFAKVPLERGEDEQA